MHAPLRQSTDEREHPTWRGGVHYFNAAQARQWIESFNKTGNVESLNRLLKHVEPLAKSILEYRCTTKHELLDELLSRIRIKLWRSLRLYDPAKGSAFSFVAKVISSTSASAVCEAWHRADRLCQFDETTESVAVSDALKSAEAVDDLIAKVRQVKTPCTDSYELAAQRWLVNSFIDCEFHIRRHEAADAMTEVFGIDYTRSRWLFDTSLVAVRRELIGTRRLMPINPVSLVKTRSAGLIRFARFLSSEEFTRLAVLLRDVPPNVILTVDPSKATAVRRGDSEAVRANVNLVLRGAPADRPLFGSPAHTRAHN
jgi:hypothetical protein